MLQKIGGVFIALFILGVLTSISGANNRNIQMESAGAGASASSFAKSCQRTMKRYHAVFHNGAPYYVTGCICIGVRMEKMGVLTSENLGGYKSVYKDVVKHNRSQMRTTLPGNAKPQLSLPQTSIGADRETASTLLSYYKHCNKYDLEGRPRIDEAMLKKMTQG